jgi:uncharacterized protein YjbI with pentapeptide repeats
MTVRDWLQLLIVPFVLAGIGFWFTMQQDARQQQIENQRAQEAQQIEDQRAESARLLEEQRTQDATLQTYLDQMGSLLLDKDLRESAEGSEVRTLARARTLTVLGRLDPNHKTAAMQFLVEAKLVQRVDERRPIIGLSGADLSGANLSWADLSDASLSGADLSDANLSSADLSDANLSNAYLGDANLRSADLSEADLSGADLSGADLSDAVMRWANLSDANLSGASVPQEELWQQAYSLLGATMPNGQKYEDWRKSKGRGEDGENGSLS